jgi:hypothetical protein
VKTVGVVHEVPASAVVMARAPLIPLPPLPLVEPTATQSEDDPQETPKREVTPVGNVGALQVAPWLPVAMVKASFELFTPSATHSEDDPHETSPR